MPILEWLRPDVRYAARAVWRTPTVTLAAIVTLALGIGATTTIFSVFQAVLLRQLPVSSPDQLYFVTHGADMFSSSSHYPWFERVSQHRELFAGVTAYHIRDFKVTTDDGIETVAGQYVSGNFHAVIGVPFQLGRGFQSENDRVSSPIAVISDGYWSRRFARNPQVIGQPLVVGGHPVTIVGVTAPGFEGMQPGRSIDVTLPLSVRIQDEPEFLTAVDTWTSMPLVVRLNEGVQVTDARSVIATTYREYMAQPVHREFSRTPTGELRSATLQPASQGSDRLRQEYERPLRVLMGMVVVVLLIACVNVANLLLTQAPARAREIAVRMSVGASRSRIARQLLTESLLLSAAGGAVALLLTAWSTEFVAALFRTGLRPIVIDLQPDSGVLMFAALISLITAVTFGVAPALKTTRIDLAQTLKLAASALSGAHRGVGQRSLVAAQMALCLVLVFGAGLLARTVYNLRNVAGGFRKDALIVFELDARDTTFPRARLEALCEDLLARLTARPQVVSGSCSTMLPVATNTEGRAVVVPGFVPGPGNQPIVFANSIDAAYFDTLSIDIVRGRAFSANDTATSARVGVISESMARYYFRDVDPIGRAFQFGRRELGPPITIVGVARDVKLQLREQPPQMAYTPLSQRQEPPSSLLATVRTSGETSAIAAAVGSELRGLTRDVALGYVRTMEEQIGAVLVGERLMAVLSASFAILALALACIGLYGVTSYDVALRSREIGIRLALGARRTQILGQVLRQASLVTLLGIAVGVAGAIGAARTLSNVLFGLAPNDLRTLSLATALLTMTALIAAYAPARRAASVDPAVTLRIE